MVTFSTLLQTASLVLVAPLAADASTSVESSDVAGQIAELREEIAQLKQENSKLAPTTVYRALTALMDQGKVHKVEGLNAFTVCRADHAHEPALLAICDSCGQVDETVAPNLAGAAKDVLQDRGFAASRHVFEVHGQCGSCSIAEGAA